MPKKKLHIISFGNPYPPQYGGAIDVYYKLQALSALGVTIYLHYFDNKETEKEHLELYCEQVFFYKKKSNILFLLSKTPYAVLARRNEALIKNLKKIDAPILIEGTQCSWILNDKSFTSRQLYVRAHNIEENYYKGLANSENNKILRLIYRSQAKKMRNFETHFNNVEGIFTLSKFEQAYFKNRYHTESAYIPVFHGNSDSAILDGQGNYALYHGDLSSADNLRAAIFFINLFRNIDFPLVIAGNYSSDLERMVEKIDNVRLEKIKDNKHLDRLLSGAHINVIKSFQQSGTKLKLVNSLFKSRFCIINENVVDDPRIVKLCEVASSKEQFIELVEKLRATHFSDGGRREVLNAVYSNKSNAQKIIEKIF
ncbi:hypothetical protein EAX61_06510 [Dokdonia sinensis]|uniref:Glycosyltransferase family 1 protein n=1 Tax=Dokdonia sinensis TaxID=2479847 RepID=A0A3M0GH55_9FLAO|nr:hypothetical protein [Dokdonia sinensis]RMB60469.1 hypothetical protein EAX61_06510 [Dokdonia sinensis]